MIENLTNKDKSTENAECQLEQAKTRYAEKTKKENKKRRRAENHHKYMMGGIIVKYFPDEDRFISYELPDKWTTMRN